MLEFKVLVVLSSLDGGNIFLRGANVGERVEWVEEKTIKTKLFSSKNLDKYEGYEIISNIPKPFGTLRSTFYQVSGSRKQHELISNYLQLKDIVFKRSYKSKATIGRDIYMLQGDTQANTWRWETAKIGLDVLSDIFIIDFWRNRRDYKALFL